MNEYRIALDGQGVLGDEEGFALLALHKEALVDPNIPVVFVVGEGVTATTPTFWGVLVEDTLKQMAEQGSTFGCSSDEATGAESEWKKFDLRFIPRVGDKEADSLSGLDRRCKIAHRFRGILISYSYLFAQTSPQRDHQNNVGRGGAAHHAL